MEASTSEDCSRLDLPGAAFFRRLSSSTPAPLQRTTQGRADAWKRRPDGGGRGGLDLHSSGRRGRRRRRIDLADADPTARPESTARAPTAGQHEPRRSGVGGVELRP
ncbi:unnamed protein product [Urochloa humidicola]